MGHKLALLIFFIQSLAFCQTFTVVNETTGITFVDTLDGTTEFRYTVRLAGSAGTLSGVVPELVPPSCAQQAGQPIFETTYMGMVGGSTSSLAVPTWANNQTRDLIFRVHMFNNTVVCGASLPCSGGAFNFQLRFTHSGSATPVTASDPSSFLRILGPPTDGFRVVDVVSQTLPSACSSFVSNRNFPVTYFGFPASLLADPEVKVFLGIDWNLNLNNIVPPLDFAFGMQSFFYPTGPNTNDAFMLKFGSLNGGQPLAPFLSPSTVILDENNVPFPMGPLGGDGPRNSLNDCVEHTWNFFDLTSLEPVAGGTPPYINHLSNTMSNTVAINPSSVSQFNFRKAALYLVKPAGCLSGVAFGNPPTAIQFQHYNLLPGGVAEVTLSLPSSWTTAGGTQLNSSYTIEWFYRNRGALTKATLPGGGATNTRNLSTNLAIPFVNASDFIVEARISRVGTNSIVSFQSPGHDLSYAQLSNRSFENAEFNPDTFVSDPDDFFDAGEVLVQELRIQNIGSFAQDVTITAGRISPGSAELAFAAREKATSFAGSGDMQEVFQTDLTTNGILDVDVLYELLRVQQACDDVSLFVEIAYVNQGMATKFRHEFTVEANCEFVENAFGIANDWVPLQNRTVPPNPDCNDSNCSNTTVTSTATSNWGFTNPGWIGSTDTGFYFYTLTSPSVGFANGLEDKISLDHQSTLKLGKGGGIVEFRTANGAGPWSDWQDLILPLEQSNPGIYSEVFDSVLSGDRVISERRVFMAMSNPQSWEYALPSTAFGNDTKVQFRFLFHLPFDTVDPGLWQINDFQYKTKLPQFDDLFLLNNSLNYNTCTPNIALTPTPGGAYTFFWYTTVEDLVDDVPTAISTDGTWAFPIPGTSTQYFVKVRRDTPGTTRVYALNIDATTTVPPFENVLVDWNTSGSPGNTDINSSGKVDVIDLILQIILDACE